MSQNVEIRTSVGELELTFNVDGSSDKSLFEAISRVQELWNNEPCGLCGHEHTKFVRRQVKKDDLIFYERVCLDPSCRAKLSYGQTKKGEQLFPRRSFGEGADRKFDSENLGWQRYRG